MATNTRSKHIKNESASVSESINSNLTTITHLIEDSDDDHKKQSHNFDSYMPDKWEVYRQYEQQHLDSIKLLTEVELLNIEQWLIDINRIYDELHYPMSRRVWQTIPYLLQNEQVWYEETKNEIKNDWSCFCKKLKQHVYDKVKLNINPSADHHVFPIKALKQGEHNFPNKSSFSEHNASLSSALSITMAREIIKSPSYFRGAQDDVIDWLEKLEQRFLMANWTDELKLKYISIHLQEDAYRWWNQSATNITSWSCFVDLIKQAFGSTKMKEVTFEQLRTYKQTIHQSITQYYDKVIELCKRVDASMTDSLKLQYLMAGVKPSLKLHIALYDPQSSEAFLSYARKVEDTFSLTNVDYDFNQSDFHTDTHLNRSTASSVNVHQNAEDQSVNVHQSSTQAVTSGRINDFSNNHHSRSRSSKNKTTKGSSVVCYSCGTPGHYARDCTRSHFQ